MALDTDFTTMAEAVKTIILTIKDDLKVTSETVLIFGTPQKFKSHTITIDFINAELTRMQPRQGQWKMAFLITFWMLGMNRAIARTLIYNALATLMKLMMKNPSLTDNSIAVEVSEATMGDLALRDQGAESASFILTVYEEPVDIPAVGA